MQGTSKLVMGATLLMVASLAIVLGLVLVLLAELYCSLLLRKRRFRITTTTNPTSTQSPQQNLLVPPPSSLYAQGVLQAPRNFLFPSIISQKEENQKPQNQYSEPHHLHETQTQEPTRLVSVPSPRPIQEATLQGSSSSGYGDGVSRVCDEHLVYISNPIYDNEASTPSRVGTPFVTPDTSPSRLEMSGSSGDDENGELPITPPLTPMKKLPAEACSVTLRDARCLGTSGSDSNSNNGLSSSSSSGSPSTSPSW